MIKSVRTFLKLKGVQLGVFEYLLLLAPFAMLFSYQPLISFGMHANMHIELAVAVIYLLVLALVGLPRIWRSKSTLITNKSVLFVALFVLWCALSLLWTPNLTRGILTLGIVGLLYLVLLAVLATQNFKKLLPALVRLTVISGLFISVVAWSQVLLAALSVPNQVTLLCAGCQATIFGFARPDGFAIEPQFLGSLLIIPIVLLLQACFTRKTASYTKLALVFLITTMILTLSRGAIYALAISGLLLTAVNFKQVKKLTFTAGLILVGIVIGLGVQGIAAQVNPKVADGFGITIAKSVNQLTLGIVDLRPKQTSITTSASGYIAESTDVRVNLSKLALETWTKSPSTAIFGVGLGGAGQSMHDFKHQTAAYEIVQNEYAEILLELGLVGMALFVAILISLVFKLRGQPQLQAILVAFMVQWLFFSGYPNALHIYLFMIVSASIYSKGVMHVNQKTN
ncbi:O-antigen ligase family protein [Candidatus Saccharibacteria bacterium]|nr:O-antigen ligase family protein [Candidatus Saccharibacteria bacterium]